MARALKLLALIGPLLCACQGGSSYEWPVLDLSGFQSAALVLRPADGPVLIDAQPIDAEDLGRFSSPDGSDIYLLLYQASLAELFVDAPGLVAEPSAGQPQRPIWPFDRGFSSRAGEAGLSEWLELPAPTLPPELALRRVPAPDVQACLAAGGCYLDRRAADDHACAPCPAASPIAAPQIAELPSWDCPAGWASETDASSSQVHSCAPPPTVAQACAEHEAQWIDQPSCAPIGPACPSAPDGWAADLIPPVIYVRGGAPAGGNGGRARPFSTLNEALTSSQAAANPTIALSPGHYLGRFALPTVRIVGACVERTFIDGDTIPIEPAVLNLLATHSATIANLTVSPSPTNRMSDLRVNGFARAHLSNVLLRDADNGVEVEHDAVLSGRHVVVQNMAGRAVRVDAGTVELEDSLIEDSTLRALVAFGAHVQLRRVAVRRSADVAIDLQGGGALSASELLVDEGASDAIQVTGVSLTLADAVIRNTKVSSFPMAEGTRGVGLAVSDGAQVSLERVDIVHSRAVGLAARASTLRMRDVFVRDLMAAPISAAMVPTSAGLILIDGLVLDSERLYVARPSTQGVVISRQPNEEVPTGRLMDTTIVATGCDHAPGCAGLIVDCPLNFVIERTHITSTPRAVLITQVGGAQFLDLQIDDAEIGFQSQSQFDAERIQLADVTGGACYDLQSSGKLEQLSITLRKRAPDTGFEQHCSNISAIGLGLFANSDAKVELSRFLIEAGPSLSGAPPAGTGLFFGGASSLDASDGTIRGVRIGSQLLLGVTPEQALLRIHYEANTFDWSGP